MLALVSEEARQVKAVRISETMRISAFSGNEIVGVWDPELSHVIIKRDQLRDRESFLATLLHEVGHAYSGASDVSEAFEQGLTRLLGLTGSAAVQ